jgi:hypothetical protein
MDDAEHRFVRYSTVAPEPQEGLTVLASRPSSFSSTSIDLLGTPQVRLHCSSILLGLYLTRGVDFSSQCVATATTAASIASGQLTFDVTRPPRIPDSGQGIGEDVCITRGPKPS